jgi:transposase
MTASILAVGVDVAEADMAVVVHTPTGAVGRPRVFVNRKAGFASLVKWLRRQATEQGCDGIHVGLEATGVYGDRLAYYLHRANGITVSVINPAQIKAFGQVRLTRTKTDGVAAAGIALFVATQHPRPWVPEDPALLHLRALATRIDQLQTMRTQESNRLKALKATEDPSTELMTSLEESKTWLDAQINALKKRLHQHIEAHPDLKQQTAFLCTIPGIAEWSAACVIAHGGSALTDRTCKQLVAHAGLAPAHRQSGRSVHGKSHIAKTGRVALRRALYMPAMGAATRNRNPILADLYQRLLDKGKPKKVAIVACMRKLLQLIHGVLKNQTAFNPALHALNA